MIVVFLLLYSKQQHFFLVGFCGRSSITPNPEPNPNPKPMYIDMHVAVQGRSLGVSRIMGGGAS